MDAIEFTAFIAEIVIPEDQLAGVPEQDRMVTLDEILADMSDDNLFDYLKKLRDAVKMAREIQAEESNDSDDSLHLDAVMGVEVA